MTTKQGPSGPNIPLCSGDVEPDEQELHVFDVSQGKPAGSAQLSRLQCESLYHQLRLALGYTATKILPSEALFGFVGWLTSQPERVTFSDKDNATLAADLLDAYIKAQGLADPRGSYADGLVAMEQGLVGQLAHRWNPDQVLNPNPHP